MQKILNFIENRCFQKIKKSKNHEIFVRIGNQTNIFYLFQFENYLYLDMFKFHLIYVILFFKIYIIYKINLIYIYIINMIRYFQ